MSHSEIRKAAFKEFNANVTKLIRAVGDADYDAQLILMSEAIRDLEKARTATIGIHGGMSN